MYLGMIKSEENKQLFLKIAALISFADHLDEEDRVSKSKGGYLYAHSRHFRDENVKKLEEFIGRKEQELQAIKLYGSEMGLELTSSNLDTLDEDVLKALYAGSETVSEKLFKNLELRETFFVDGLKELLKRQEDDHPDEVVPVEERKVMLFEATGMAYADGECSELERALLNELAATFDIDGVFIDEASDIVKAFTRLNEQGLELINE